MKMGELVLAELVHSGEEELVSAGIPDAKYDARALLLHACGKTLAEYAAAVNECADEETVRLYRKAVKRRAAGEPLQYITQSAPFFGRDFYITHGVLIPRFDTETLIEAVLPVLSPGMRILDLCTGSGCILITLILEGPVRLDGTGIDLSDDAIACARENASRFQVKASFEKSDLFSAVTGRFDVITANPPYIPSGEIRTLDREVREHEPAEALDGGPDGLEFYRRILEEAASYLVPGGCLACEIGFDQGESVLALYREAGFRGARICRDLSGRDRVIIGAWDV